MKPFLAQFKLFRNLMAIDKKFFMLFALPGFLFFSIILLAKYYHINSFFLLLSIILFVVSYLLYKFALYIYNEGMEGASLFIPIVGLFAFTCTSFSLYIIFMFFYDVAHMF